jgi:hypothetical protein
MWLCCCQAEFSSMTAWAEELAKTATLDSAAGDAPPKSEAEEYGIKHFTVRVLGRPFHPERWCERCAACCQSCQSAAVSMPFPRAVCDLCWSRHLQPLQPFHHDSGWAGGQH